MSNEIFRGFLPPFFGRGLISIYARPLRGQNHSNRIITESQKTEAGETETLRLRAVWCGAADADNEKKKRQQHGLATESNKTVTNPYLPVRWSPIIDALTERQTLVFAMGRNNSQ